MLHVYKLCTNVDFNRVIQIIRLSSGLVKKYNFENPLNFWKNNHFLQSFTSSPELPNLLQTTEISRKCHIFKQIFYTDINGE